MGLGVSRGARAGRGPWVALWEGRRWEREKLADASWVADMSVACRDGGDEEEAEEEEEEERAMAPQEKKRTTPKMSMTEERGERLRGLSVVVPAALAAGKPASSLSTVLLLKLLRHPCRREEIKGVPSWGREGGGVTRAGGGRVAVAGLLGVEPDSWKAASKKVGARRRGRGRLLASSCVLVLGVVMWAWLGVWRREMCVGVR